MSAVRRVISRSVTHSFLEDYQMLIRTMLTAMLMALIVVPQAHAANGEWTTVASACVPDESAAGGYSAEGAAVALPAVASVLVRCNITDPADFMNVVNPMWTAMDVTYHDFDGMANDSRVRVELVRVDEFTGQSFTVTGFNSNVFGAGQQLQTKVFAHAFDFTNNAYYLVIGLWRTMMGGDTRIQRVRLY
jgi:hypothetical protein